jgi:hypothetical protein
VQAHNTLQLTMPIGYRECKPQRTAARKKADRSGLGGTPYHVSQGRSSCGQARTSKESLEESEDQKPGEGFA